MAHGGGKVLRHLFLGTWEDLFCVCITAHNLVKNNSTELVFNLKIYVKNIHKVSLKGMSK